MIGTQRVLGLVVARGNSKGLPGKHVRLLAGKPLIVWTIEAALGSTLLDRVILSTDCEGIADVARAAGCAVPFRRPSSLAQDCTPSSAVVDHALEVLEAQGERYDWVVLLQPTSPLRVATDIDRAIELCTARGATMCVSVTRARQNPFWMITLDELSRARPLFPGPSPARRQDLPDTYAYNGALYVVRTAWVRSEKQIFAPNMVAYVMPAARSVDIDDETDFRVAEIAIGQLVPPEPYTGGP